jgi:hypothetical protein
MRLRRPFGFARSSLRHGPSGRVPVCRNRQHGFCFDVRVCCIDLRRCERRADAAQRSDRDLGTVACCTPPAPPGARTTKKLFARCGSARVLIFAWPRAIPTDDCRLRRTAARFVARSASTSSGTAGSPVGCPTGARRVPGKPTALDGRGIRFSRTLVCNGSAASFASARASIRVRSATVAACDAPSFLSSAASTCSRRFSASHRAHASSVRAPFAVSVQKRAAIMTRCIPSQSLRSKVAEACMIVQ